MANKKFFGGQMDQQGKNYMPPIYQHKNSAVSYTISYQTGKKNCLKPMTELK